MIGLDKEVLHVFKEIFIALGIGYAAFRLLW